MIWNSYSKGTEVLLRVEQQTTSTAMKMILCGWFDHSVGSISDKIV